MNETMTMVTPFEAFNLFNAIKTHFNDDNYDALKYNFSTRSSQESFNKRKDKPLFNRIVYKYQSTKQIKDYFVANIITDPTKMWISSCTEANYENWKKRVDGLRYNFKNDCQTLVKRHPDTKYLFKGYPPKILNEYFGERINLETLVIFNSMTDGAVSRFEDEAQLFTDVKRLINKYETFLNIDIKTLAKDAREIFTGKTTL